MLHLWSPVGVIEFGISGFGILPRPALRSADDDYLSQDSIRFIN
jgi:hypothetical protein